MNKNNFRFFGVFLLLTIVLSLYVVWAAAPTALKFTQNTTLNYDADGTVHLNWTGIAADNSYNIYIYADDSLYTSAVNGSATGYVFTNTTDANYTFTVEAVNGTAPNANSTNISMIVDTTNPVVSYIAGTPANNAGSNTLTSLFVNVSVVEANNDSLLFSLYNSTSLVRQNASLISAGLNINWTGLPVNVVYRYNVTVNDSATNSFTAPTRTFTLDNVAPSVSLTKTTGGQTSLELAILGAEGTCTADRSGATISGSVLTEKSLSCGKSYTYIVTCTDSAGNAGSSSATSFSTTGCSSGGPVPKKPKKASYSFSKITPGVVTILKNFDAEIGIREIKIEVNNPAQSVSITVTKYDGKPAEVSVEKSGKVYKYLQVETTNLADKLGRATLTLQVGKSWLSSNGLDANEIALFRFNEVTDKWNELATTYIGPEGDNEIYDVEVTDFSYFAISKSEGLVKEETGETTTGDGLGIGGEKSAIWWKVLVLVLVILVIYVGMNRKKYSKFFKQ